MILALRPSPIGRTGTLWLLAAVLAVSPQTAGAVSRYVCAEALIAAQHPAGAIPPPRAKAATTAPLSQVTALVVFTGFRGQQTRVPSWAGSLFDPDRPGSVSHFYHEMSFGGLTLRGTVAPRRYLASGDASLTTPRPAPRSSAAIRSSCARSCGRWTTTWTWPSSTTTAPTAGRTPATTTARSTWSWS